MSIPIKHLEIEYEDAMYRWETAIRALDEVLLDAPEHIYREAARKIAAAQAEAQLLSRLIVEARAVREES